MPERGAFGWRLEACGLMASDEAEDFDLGDRLSTKGLVNAAQHNGKIDVVIALADPATGRVGVRLNDGFEFRIKLCNLELPTNWT